MLVRGDALHLHRDAAVRRQLGARPVPNAVHLVVSAARRLPQHQRPKPRHRHVLASAGVRGVRFSVARWLQQRANGDVCRLHVDIPIQVERSVVAVTLVRERRIPLQLPHALRGGGRRAVQHDRHR